MLIQYPACNARLDPLPVLSREHYPLGVTLMDKWLTYASKAPDTLYRIDEMDGDRQNSVR